MASNNDYRVGIDLGGTNIVAGVVDKDFNIIARAECKTAIPRPESDVCDSMADIVKKAVKKAVAKKAVKKAGGCSGRNKKC